MILSSLILTNFGVFRGKHTVQLSPRPGRRIVLFGGKNGAGKSTLFEAVRVCLYGPGALGFRLSKEAYLGYLDQRIHVNPNLLIQPTFASVALEFQYAEVEALHTYTVTRSWERRGDQRIIEHLDVQRDGKPLDDLAAEHWQDFVRDLIPPGVSQLFFFDGEKIQQLAEDTSDQQTLAEAIKSLLGLDVAERLQADLGIYLSRLLKPGRDGRFAREVEDLQEETTRAEQQLQVLHNERAQYEAQLTEARSTITRVETKIASEGGTFTRNREGLLQQQAQLKARISQQEDAVRQLCAGLLPFALIPRLCLQLKEQLALEERVSQVEAGQTLLRNAEKDIVQRVDADEFWSALPPVSGELKAVLRNRLLQTLRETLRVEQTGEGEVIHQLSVPVHQQLLSWIDQATNEIPQRARVLARELESCYRELQRIEEGLRRIPADDVLKPRLEELHVLHQTLAEVSKHALLKDDEVKATESRLRNLQQRYNQITEKLAAQVTLTTRIHLANRVQKVLDEYKVSLLDKKVSQLQGIVADCFNTLCRKKDTLRRITIDPKDFSVTLYDRQNRPLPKTQLSAGEKQIYAIAMLWALAKTSGRPLPIIIDTPLGRLDSDHRKLLVHHYFPVASHQVILLSTDTEVDQSYFVELQHHIAHAYRLDFDPQENDTKIKSGYFWKEGNEAHKTTAFQGGV